MEHGSAFSLSAFDFSLIAAYGAGRADLGAEDAFTVWPVCFIHAVSSATALVGDAVLVDGAAFLRGSAGSQQK